MRKIESYICEVCGSEYSEKNKAIKCETNHNPPIKIVGMRYIGFGNDNKGYPIVIKVKMKDGEIVTYKR